MHTIVFDAYHAHRHRGEIWRAVRSASFRVAANLLMVSPEAAPTNSVEKLTRGFLWTKPTGHRAEEGALLVAQHLAVANPSSSTATVV